MFKSPSGKISMQKKNTINFIKSVGSPKNPKLSSYNSAKTINTLDHELYLDKFKKQSLGLILQIDINFQNSSQLYRTTFSYHNETEMSELIVFLKKQLNDQLIYFQTKDFNLDYLLTLEDHKVKELNLKKIDLKAFKIKISSSNNFLKNFEIIKCIGTGGFSKVYLSKGYGKILALKVINKDFIISNEKQNIIDNQRSILCKCSNHPFITKMYLSFETTNYLIFCMQYCNGGELFNLLRKVKRMKEEDARFYFLQTLAAIIHLHEQNILYRDLKPENIIIDSEGHIRLADYGLSKIMNEDLTYSFCGSAEYMAPQMLLKKGHSFEIDYYCLGALLYELIIGLPPYYSRNQSQLFSNIINNDLTFPPNIQISKHLKKFLMRLLEKNTEIRFKKIQDILEHPWLQNTNMNEVLNKKLTPPYRTNMFENNFDDSDFAQEQPSDLAKIEEEKEIMYIQNQQFSGFTFISQEIQQIQKNIEEKDEKFDFKKKTGSIQTLQHHQSQKQILMKNGSIKSIDSNSFIQRDSLINESSPRGVHNPSKSSEKIKLLINQHSHCPTIQPIFHYASKGKGSSEVVSNSASKMIYNTKSIPFIDRSHNYISNDSMLKLQSPVNINNFINIYTGKSPQHRNYPNNNNSINTSQNQLHMSVNNSYQPRKVMSYANFPPSSIQKKFNNSAYKNSSFGYSNSYQRNKFSSLDKSGPTTTAYLKNHPYIQHNQNVSPAQRGYLSNFKERFNPNPKMKKSYRNNQKVSFNFISTNTNHPNKAN